MIKNILVTVIVAAIVAGGFTYALAPQLVSEAMQQASSATQQASDSLGASAANVQQVFWQFTKGVMIEGPTRTGVGSSAIFTASGVLGTSQNIDYWTNKTGRTVLIEGTDVIQQAGTGGSSKGYASSTMRISVFATTTISNINPYVSPKVSSSTMSNFLIDNVRVATSSPVNYVWNGDIGGGTNATGTIAVPDGSSVVIFLQQGDYQANCTGSVCEAATSTNRGFNLGWFLSGHYVP